METVRAVSGREAGSLPQLLSTDFVGPLGGLRLTRC